MRNIEKIAQRKIEDVLVEGNYVDATQLENFIAEFDGEDTDIEKALIENEILGESELTEAICQAYHLPYLSVHNYKVSPELIKSIPPNLMYKYHFFPLDKVGNIMTVLLAGMPRTFMLEDLKQVVDCEIFVFMGVFSEIEAVLQEHALSEDAAAEQFGAQQTEVWHSIFDIANEEIQSELKKKQQESKHLYGDTLSGKDTVSVAEEEGQKSDTLSDGTLTNSMLRSEYSSGGSLSEESDVLEGDTLTGSNTNPESLTGNETDLHLADKKRSETLSGEKTNSETLSGNQTNTGTLSGKESTGGHFFQGADVTQEIEEQSPEEPPEQEVDFSHIINESDTPEMQLKKLATWLKKNPHDYDALNKYVETAINFDYPHLAIEQLATSGKIFDQAGDQEGAATCFEYILRLDPQHETARNYLDQLPSE